MKKNTKTEIKIMKNKYKKKYRQNSVVNLSELIMMKKTLTFLKSTIKYLGALKNHLKN